VQSFDGFGYTVQTKKNGNAGQWFYPSAKAAPGSASTVGFSSPVALPTDQINLAVTYIQDGLTPPILKCSTASRLSDFDLGILGCTQWQFINIRQRRHACVFSAGSRFISRTWIERRSCQDRQRAGRTLLDPRALEMATYEMLQRSRPFARTRSALRRPSPSVTKFSAEALACRIRPFKWRISSCGAGCSGASHQFRRTKVTGQELAPGN